MPKSNYPVGRVFDGLDDHERNPTHEVAGRLAERDPAYDILIARVLSFARSK